jgi:P-type Cu2+ transporter
MKCAGCVKAVENQLTQVPGVTSASVNLVTEVAVVTCDPGQVRPEALAQKLTQAGFPAQSRLGTDGESGAAIAFIAQRQQAAQDQQRQLAIALVLLVLSSFGHLQQLGGIAVPGLTNIWLHAGLATAALLGPGRRMAIDGWRGLWQNAPNMNTLVSLGTWTAYLTSVLALLFPTLGWDCFFDEPVMLVGFILLGRSLEQQARTRAASAFQSLLALQPKVARLIAATPNATGVPAYIEIPVAHVRVGEWLQVLPGDKIPVDGEVVAGQTTVDEAMLTGEGLPVLKQAGDWVSAGTLNCSGAIAIRSTRTGNATTLAQIIALVESAQTRKAPIQNLADTIAGYFTYGVMAIAALTFGFWYFIGTSLWADSLVGIGMGHGSSGHLMMHPMLSTPEPAISPLLISLKLAIAVLVVACPCALGLATPTAILVGSGIGAERGLLIRGGDVLERIHQIDTIVFDKTGTLTLATPQVTDCRSLVADLSPATVLQLAATVESGTQHPLAAAIRQQAQSQNLPLLPGTNFQTLPGLGISAQVTVDTAIQLVRVGSAAWLNQVGMVIATTEHENSSIERQIPESKTCVYIAVDQRVVGAIAVANPLREDAVATIAALQDLGLRVLLLTGDQAAAATATAQALGLAADQVLAAVPPDRKAEAIAQLQAQGHIVAMVGDGINDAPALAQADVGIALQSGTDVAAETAGVILTRDRLSDVVAAIRLSRATFQKIRQNLFWAFAYNVLGIPVAAGLLLPTWGILLNPAAAGAMMALSSVSVVTNSLGLYLTASVPRARRTKNPG